MSGEISVKAPIAALVLMLLTISVMLNIWKFTQPPTVVQVPTAVPSGASAMPATLPSGEPNPLMHVPKNPQDAVGMPDATGGAGTSGQ
jgi:hypothetical protein